LLTRAPNGIRPGQWVEGEAWRNDPDIGLFAILEKSWSALLPKYEPHSLSRGEAARFRIANVLQDGKVELSLRALSHDAVDEDKERLLALLSKPNPVKLGDHSPPEQIRTLCGMSKKAFKRAAGGLLKERRVVIDDKGCFVLSPRQG
jgi:uncharacterized protein